MFAVLKVAMRARIRSGWVRGRDRQERPVRTTSSLSSSLSSLSFAWHPRSSRPPRSSAHDHANEYVPAPGSSSSPPSSPVPAPVPDAAKSPPSSPPRCHCYPSPARPIVPAPTAEFVKLHCRLLFQSLGAAGPETILGLLVSPAVHRCAPYRDRRWRLCTGL